MADLHPDRALVITASEAASMMGVDERRSPYALWAQKTGLAEPDDLEDNDPVFWGTVLEPAVAEGVRRRTGWDLRLCQRFVRHPTLPLGATPDYLIVPHGPDGLPLPYADWGVLEVKCMDLFRWLKLEAGAAAGVLDLEQDPSGTWSWRRPKKEPPAEYQVQLQVQMACTGLSWGVLAILVGGNRLELYRYDRHDAAIAAIGARAVEFWDLVERRESPPIDWEVDADAVIDLHRFVEPGRTVVGDEELQALAMRREELGEIERAAKEERGVLKAKILVVMGTAEEALLPNGKRVTAATVAETYVAAHTKKGSRPVYVREAKKEPKRGKR